MLKKVPFFWVAFYSDGSVFPQFEENGQQHHFKEIDQSKLEKFGWFPISATLIKVLNNPMYKSDSTLPYFVIHLKSNQKLIALRREWQQFYSYSHCLKCGFEWQWMPKKPDGSIGDAGLPRYGEKYCFFEPHPRDTNKRIYGIICPRCGARTQLKCPDCNLWWNKIDERGTLKCPKCGKQPEQTIAALEAHKRDLIFLLGYEEPTEDGKNKKFIMFIRPDGTVQLSDDFNAL